MVSFNHIALHVKDIETSVKFYGDTLGLPSFEVPDSLKKVRAWFQLGNGQMIHLLAGRTAVIENDRNGSHFSLFIKSIDETLVFLKKKGIQQKRNVQKRNKDTKREKYKKEKKKEIR